MRLSKLKSRDSSKKQKLRHRLRLQSVSKRSKMLQLLPPPRRLKKPLLKRPKPPLKKLR